MLDRIGGPIYLVAVALSTSAWALSIAGTANCDYVKRDVTLVPDQNSTLPPQVEETLRLAFEDHGVGFWSWSLGGECMSYCNSWGACPNPDTKFRSAKAFSATTDVLGGLGMFVLWFMVCGPMDPGILRMCALFFFLCTLFEGLTLLILRSNVCNQVGFFGYLNPFWPELPLPDVQSVSCSLSQGSKLSIGSTVCWFFAAAVTTAIRPKENRLNREEN